MNIVGIIPARFASTRLPGKPLIDLAGKTMVQRVYEQASKCKDLQTVVVATDDTRIYDHVKSFGGQVVMTPSHLPSGTDRCYAALQQLPGLYDYVVNIQGDEPLIDPEQISQLTALLDGQVPLATLIKPEADAEHLSNNNEVKVVLNAKQEALYFSRAWVPAQKGVPQHEWTKNNQYYLHVGMYAYRSDVLAAITELPVAALEIVESLEQLRWLANGYSIKCGITYGKSPSIDTAEDWAQVLELLTK